MLFSIAASRRAKSGQTFKIQFLDIKNAYLHARATRDLYIELPEEDAEEGMCGKLNMCLYGTKDAAENWEMHYKAILELLGFKQGVSNPCVFYNKEKDIRTVVYGDDFTSIGDNDSLLWFKSELAAHLTLVHKATLGPEHGDDKSVRLLNRIVEYTDNAITFEADQRHVERIVRSLNLDTTRSNKDVTTPGVKATDVTEQMGEPLTGKAVTSFRSLVMRAAYVAQDRADIQFATKELAIVMSAPTQGDLTALKRLGRYLRGKPRCVLVFRFQEASTYFDAWVDSDWAGCIKTRKSTSGGVLMLGSHCLKSWSSTQSVIALSSGEAEFYGIVKGTAIGLGAVSLMKDMGIDMKLRVRTDATTGKAICSRRGLGKTRHIHCQYLWIQERVQKGDVTLIKVSTKDNIADMLTKHLAAADLEKFMHEANLVVTTGRHALAPESADDLVDELNSLSCLLAVTYGVINGLS